MKLGQRVLFCMLIGFVLLLFAAVLLPTLANSREIIAVVQALPLGWLGFLRRTLPEVTINWAGIGMVVLCSALILVCLHSLLNFLSKGRFQFRWSVGIFASLWLLFCLIIAVAGLSRTSALLKGEKWYQARSGYGDLSMASLHASMALSEARSDLNYVRHLLLDREVRFGRPLWEEFEFLVCPARGASANPVVVVIPRQAKAREQAGFTIVGGTDSDRNIPITKLQERLAELRGNGE